MTDIDKAIFYFKEIIGRLPEFKNPNDRSTMHNLVYVLQCAGVEFDYYFSYYLTGVYSCRLADQWYKKEYAPNSKNFT